MFCSLRSHFHTCVTISSLYRLGCRHVPARQTASLVPFNPTWHPFNFNRQHLFYSDVTFQSSSEIQCGLLKSVRLASLKLPSCSVYPIIFVASFKVFISVSKQFKVEICEERYHKSHHSAMVLDGSSLPHKMFLRPAQRDMLQGTF